MSKNLFIVCMNNSGSTLLHHYLSECEKVVQLPRLKPSRATSSEGHNYAGASMPHPRDFGVAGLWTEKPVFFGKDENYEWDKIKKSWMEGWQKECGAPLGGKILLEKSPPNVIRANLLQDNFPNSYFIVMVRDPYAVSEGMRRRHGHNIQRAAEHCGSVLRFQSRNLSVLKNVVWFTYSDLCDRREYVKKRIIEMLPELEDLSFDSHLDGHHSLMGRKPMPMVNLNKKQISNLGKRDLYIIKNVLLKYKKEMSFFGFKNRG
jgi:hypothetical protein